VNEDYGDRRGFESLTCCGGASLSEVVFMVESTKPSQHSPASRICTS
jgi:hypothetical protein